MNVSEVTGCEDSSRDDEAPFEMLPPDKRVYAWGFRNPFRLWADPQTGKLWVGDVGEGKQEEISIVEKGKHYGYPFFEGTQPYTQQQQPFQPAGACMGMTPASACVAPVVTHPTPEGGAVMGGRILDGCDWPAAWKARYLYGDHGHGMLWTVDVNATRDGVVEGSRKDFADTNNVTAMQLGSDNALYVVELGAGRVTRITAKGAPATPGSCPTADPAPGQGGGGGNGSGGTAGQGAGQNAGGQATGGNPPGMGGNNTSAGNNPGTSGSSNPGAGTSSATAGAGGGSTGDSGSCGCRVAGGRGTAALALAGALAFAGVAFGRRRARRSRG
jgi:hypothetical protein